MFLANRPPNVHRLKEEQHGGGNGTMKKGAMLLLALLSLLWAVPLTGGAPERTARTTVDNAQSERTGAYRGQVGETAANMALIDAQRSETAASMAAPLIDEPLAATAADAAARSAIHMPFAEVAADAAAQSAINAPFARITADATARSAIHMPFAEVAADAAAQRPTNTPHEEITTGVAAHTLIDAEDAADDDAAADESIRTAPPVGMENRAWRYVAAGMFLSAGAVFTLVAVRGGEKSGGD